MKSRYDTRIKETLGTMLKKIPFFKKKIALIIYYPKDHFSHSTNQQVPKKWRSASTAQN